MSSISSTPGEKGTTDLPRAIIHKQILDTAESQPNATIEEIAGDVSGASTSLVERVLSEYGDPAESEQVEAGSGSGPQLQESTSHDSEPPSPGAAVLDDVPPLAELTEKQQDVVHAIRENPKATQRELADILGVSGATVSVHANSIDGFDWEKRGALARAMVKEESTRPQEARTNADTDTAVNETIVELQDRVERLEKREQTCGSGGGMNSELAHKVVHACMSSEQINEEEELEVISTIFDQ